MSIIDDIREQNPQSLVVKADKGKKKLIVVESATKAKEIMHFLDSNWKALPTKGWIKDIIQPKDVKPDDKPDYGRYGINVNNMDEMLSYVPGGMKMLSAIRTEINTGNYDTLICSGDPDRAGSGISAQIAEFLAKDTRRQGMRTVRACWHEITRKAVVEGLANAVEMQDDRNAVEAERARMEFDRLFGYSVSPLLWLAVAAGTSGGRAQSPALRLVVERERKRMNFVSASYYGIDGVFNEGTNKEIIAALVSFKGQKIASSADFNYDGNVKDGVLLLNDNNIQSILNSLDVKEYKITDIKKTKYTRNPPIPYTTSSFQQNVGTKLGLSSKRAMQIAQQLFENAFQTYSRTDSPVMSMEGINACRKIISNDFNGHMPTKPRIFKSKANAQEGHECIRPVVNENTGLFIDLKTAKKSLSNKSKFDDKAFDVYKLVWQRSVASQMDAATGTTTTITIKSTDNEAIFSVASTTIDYKGFMEVYDEL